MNYSWSQLQSALACGQRWDYNYRQGLERKPSKENASRLLGSLFHEGIAAYLQNQSWQAAVEAYIQAEAVKWAEEQEYLQLLDDVANEAHAMLSFYLPQLPDYKVILVEHEFRLDNGFGGRIDALVEIDGKLVLIDWKTRGAFGDATLIALDGQLYAYAHALHELGYDVREVAIVEFRTTLPKPASMKVSKGQYTGEPNTGAASYDTTWEAWSKEVASFGTDPEQYRELMMPKLKTIDDYVRTTVGFVSNEALETTAERLEAAQKQIDFYASLSVVPAAYSSHACKTCEFKSLCELARHRMDDSLIREQYYVDKYQKP